MRPLTWMACFLMIASCYAYKIVNIESVYPDALKPQEAIDARLPVKSTSTAGHESRHPVRFSGFSNPIFIIGDDPFSKQWLNEHAKELRELHALGFITNIKNPETLQALQSTTELPLLPANVDDLMLVLDASHYPLIMSEGVVWQ